MSHDEIRAALEPLAERARPFAAEKRRLPHLGPPPDVVHFDVPYRKWDGPPLPWADDFGKKGGQVYSRDGTEPQRSCNEVEVVKRLRRVRDHALWISSYSPGQIPAVWRAWTAAPNEAPEWLLKLDDEVRQMTGHATGGIPDVVAWNESDPLVSALLVECKGPKESFKEGQEDWVVAAAFAHGLGLHQLAVAVRQFV
jgi:hypothetical protein